MPTSRGEWSLFIVGCAAIAALVALNVTAWQDYSASEQTTTPQTDRGTGAAANAERDVTTAAIPSAPVQSGDIVSTTQPDVGVNQAPSPAATPRLADLRLTAATGDCWLEIRAGSASGSFLYGGVLAQGETLRFRRRALWIRAGAPLYLAVTLNGKPVENFPETTADALVTARGVEILSLG